MSDFNPPFTVRDVLALNNITCNTVTNNIRIQCPFCSKNKQNKDLGIELEKGVFNCFKCRVSGNNITYFHALLNNLTFKEAYHDIVNQLGCSNHLNNEKFEHKEIKADNFIQNAEEADDKKKDKVYSCLLKNLSLLENHKKDLMNRGFTEIEIYQNMFCSYPQKNKDGITEEYFKIPKKLMNQQMSLYGIPGFYKTKNKDIWTMCSCKGGIIVPYRNFQNEITGIQIRKNNEDLEEGEHKYIWFTSANYKDGCKAKTQLHYATDFVWNPKKNRFYPLLKNNSIAYTEGAMKGDLAHAVSDMPFLCTPGVSCAYKELEKNLVWLKEIGLKHVDLCFDMDCIMNINVLEAMKKTIDIITKHDLTYDVKAWDNKVIMADGNQRIIKPFDDFIFTIDTIDCDSDVLKKNIERIKNLDIKNIAFAFENKTDVTEDTIVKINKIIKLCQENNLKFYICKWKLKIKGIDDLYVTKKRNIVYV